MLSIESFDTLRFSGIGFDDDDAIACQHLFSAEYLKVQMS